MDARLAFLAVDPCSGPDSTVVLRLADDSIRLRDVPKPTAMKAILYFCFVIFLGFALDGCAVWQGFREFDNKEERSTK